jgi:hypothetical protein
MATKNDVVNTNFIHGIIAASMAAASSRALFGGGRHKIPTMRLFLFVNPENILKFSHVDTSLEGDGNSTTNRATQESASALARSDAV